MPSFGASLKARRLRARKTLRGLARAVQVSPTTIHLIEGGRAKPSEELAARLSASLRWPYLTLMVSAGRVPSVVTDYLLRHPAELALLYRLATGRKVAVARLMTRCQKDGGEAIE